MASHDKRENPEEDMDEGLGCGLLAKVTTEAYVKALKRDLPTFAGFFPAKSEMAYLLKVSVWDEEHDLLEPATKEDVRDAENRMKTNSYAENHNKPGVVPVVAFVEQVVDSENKSTELLVMPPYDKPIKKGYKILKKEEFTDLTLLVPVCNDMEVDDVPEKVEDVPEQVDVPENVENVAEKIDVPENVEDVPEKVNEHADVRVMDDHANIPENEDLGPLPCSTPVKTENGECNDMEITYAPNAPKRNPVGARKRGRPRKLNFDDCVISPEIESNNNISMAVVESSKLIVDPENAIAMVKLS